MLGEGIIDASPRGRPLRPSPPIANRQVDRLPSKRAWNAGCASVHA